MRLVTWNCSLALSSKLPRLLELKPDVAVIQECEKNLEHIPPGATYRWIGENPRKGLGVLCFGSSVEIDPLYRSTWAYFMPVQLPEFRLRLLATWAYNHRAARFGPEHTGRPMAVLRELRDWLSKGTSIVAGDFNHSVVWDRPDGAHNFALIDSELRGLGLQSAYHSGFAEPLGRESRHTYFHTKNAEKPYHIDYVYVHASIPVRGVHVQDFDEWRDVSDHVPIIVDTA
jgi:hypothetical protein